ncbi:MAG: hypothetical protein JRC77_00535, partial [Deltaproteobacteria bacterium]|nr:hypothetical protein [Deltaproteobacteria bacterium]
MYTFINALLFLLPGRGPSNAVARNAVFITGFGLLLMLAGSAVPNATPVLANYVPTIDHGLFQSGQVIFGLGIFASLLDRRLFSRNTDAQADSSLPCEIPPAAAAGLRAAAITLILAAVTFVCSWLRQPQGVEVTVYYELLSWGGGHVLALVCVLAMVSVWLILLTQSLGESPVSEQTAILLFGCMVLPWFIAPFLTVNGTWTSNYRTGFTDLMRWGIFPVVTIFFILCMSSLVRATKEKRVAPVQLLTDVRISGFLASSLLTFVGFSIGASISGSNTMIPAHYHASLGGITVAFMAVTYMLFEAFGVCIRSKLLKVVAAWQPALYGVGMAMFAAGFMWAGANGMGRKLYGAEQASRGLAETLGLGIMGIGGLISIVGGLLYLTIVSTARWRKTNVLCEH